MPAISVIWTAVISIPAPSSSQPQARTTPAPRPTASSSRSRLSAASSKVGGASGGLGAAELLLVLVIAMHEAIRPPGDMRERTVATTEIELDRADALREAGGVLSLMEDPALGRSEEHTSELQSLMRISYAVFCLKKKKND